MSGRLWAFMSEAVIGGLDRHNRLKVIHDSLN